MNYRGCYFREGTPMLKETGMTILMELNWSGLTTPTPTIPLTKRPTSVNIQSAW